MIVEILSASPSFMKATSSDDTASGLLPRLQLREGLTGNVAALGQFAAARLQSTGGNGGYPWGYVQVNSGKDA